jgi:shikimate kinase
MLLIETGSDKSKAGCKSVTPKTRSSKQEEEGTPPVILDRPLVLVGLMGAGKSAIGRRLAHRLQLPFHDSDDEIEGVSGCPVPEIFARYGEDAFRDVERKVVLRLLDDGPQVLATGGGAFMDPTIRKAVAEKGLSLWLKASLPVLVERTARRGNRPLLAEGDAKEILKNLINVRYPVYGTADITVESRNRPLDAMTASCLTALRRYFEAQQREAEGSDA